MSGKYKYPYKVSQSVPPCMFLVSSPVTYSTSWCVCGVTVHHKNYVQVQIKYSQKSPKHHKSVVFPA